MNELIIIPKKDNGYNAEILADMVKEINSTEVPKEDFLSDNVYCFNREDRTLRMAQTGEKMQLRVA